jgi:hypothetical protein
MSVGTVRMLFCSWSGVAQEMQRPVLDHHTVLEKTLE